VRPAENKGNEQNPLFQTSEVLFTGVKIVCSFKSFVDFPKRRTKHRKPAPICGILRLVCFVYDLRVKRPFLSAKGTNEA
jgi:hypothetical protein